MKFFLINTAKIIILPRQTSPPWTWIACGHPKSLRVVGSTFSLDWPLTILSQHLPLPFASALSFRDPWMTYRTTSTLWSFYGTSACVLSAQNVFPSFIFLFLWLLLRLSVFNFMSPFLKVSLNIPHVGSGTPLLNPPGTLAVKAPMTLTHNYPLTCLCSHRLFILKAGTTKSRQSINIFK